MSFPLSSFSFQDFPKSALSQLDKVGLELALSEAKLGYSEGGIPIGSVILRFTEEFEQRVRASRSVEGRSEDLSLRDQDVEVLGKGHNLRLQKGSPTLHGEISALENAGRLKAAVYEKCTLYTTLSPCSMCTGATLLYKIPRVVIGENTTFMGDEELLRQRGVEVVVVDDSSCKSLMTKFIEEKPEEWNEDIGELPGTTTS
ncbi:cytidine deaminase-like protein [Pluteus cervinus]|uniref:Cytidine deaminase-like protein n=1 Tax=Pluteus cervinus TaxID=181527 RepID=A0ACD3A7Q5_9AGAR|nr:cytidine deaminase-like protein [Pluteus cervinus]